YTELRDTLRMTDGNATAHLRTLLEAGYIAVTKSLEGGRAATSYALTATGRRAFAAYVGLLEQIVAQNRPPTA
ncbi:MAG: transcriptional regulator, partial [Verrucomicrobiae bacterium]|nr:transcriptional regulator [Verrucomicrobiae bacterium]